jgi:hypothetical protein
MPWIKLYTELLDDPDVGKLPELVKLRFIQLLLYAGELDAEGYLISSGKALSLEDIAWRLRLDPQQLDNELKILEAAGLVDKKADTWLIPSFSERQGRSQNEKRRQWRERQRRHREKNRSKAKPAEAESIQMNLETDGTSEIEEVIPWLMSPEHQANVTGDRCDTPHLTHGEHVTQVMLPEEEVEERNNRFKIKDNTPPPDGDLRTRGAPEIESPDDELGMTVIRHFMKSFNLSVFTTTQVEVLEELMGTVGEERLLGLIDWAVESDIPVRHALQEIQAETQRFVSEGVSSGTPTSPQTSPTSNRQQVLPKREDGYFGRGPPGG